jgi:hypothetical protein
VGDLLVNPIHSSNPDFAVTQPSSGYPVVISHDFCFPFQVRFSPHAPGPQMATLTLLSNDPVHPFVKVRAAAGGLVPQIAVAGSGEFGAPSAWSPREKTFAVCSTGGCALQVAAAAVDCADFTLADHPVPRRLAPGSCLDLTVAFTPTLPGTRRCRLTVTSDDPASPAVVRGLVAATPPGAIVRVGLAQPHGRLAQRARQGSAFEVGLRWSSSPHWAWEIALGNTRLDGRPAPDVKIPSFAATARYTLNPGSAFHLFLAAGPSVHHFEPGLYRLGGDLALGAELALGRRCALELQYRYRWASGGNEYTQAMLGLTTSF